MADDPRKRRVGRVELEDAHEKIERLQQQQRDHAAATRQDKAKARPETGETSTRPDAANKRSADQFREPTRLEKFAQRLLKKVGRDSPNEFRLPSGRMLSDRRGMSGAVARDAGSKVMSDFEAVMVERFEAGAKIIKQDASGAVHFLKKSAKQWMQFFQGFMSRTVKKEVAVRDLADSQVIRAVLKQTGVEGRGMMIGDLALRNGQVEKFARMPVDMQRVASLLGDLDPGSQVSRQQMAAVVNGEAVQYLAIGPRGPEVQVFDPRPTAGIFTNLRTEAQVAERLGLARDGSRAGLASAMRERSIHDDPEHRFVPWWSWDRENRGGAKRWFVPVAMFTCIAILGTVFWLILRGM